MTASPRLRGRFLVAACLTAAALFAPSPAPALTHRPGEGVADARVIPAPWLDTLSEAEPEGGRGPAAAAVAKFRGRHAGRWTIGFDRRTGGLSFIEGEGFPFAPGNGTAPRDLAEAAPRGLALLDAEGDLLRPAVGELRLNPDRSAWLEDGRIVFLDYDWIVDGVPVDGGRVFLRVNHGNVIQMGAARIGRGLPPAKPVVDAAVALDRLFAHAGGRGDDDVILAAPSLIYLARPRGDSQVPWGGGITYRLAWRASFRRASETMTWQGDVDAHTGEILAFEDVNRYARVTGGIYPRSPNEPEEVRPFVNTRVVAGGASILTGDAGTFAYTSGPAFTALDGQYFRVICAGCSSPERAFAFADQGTGDLELGIGGPDEIGNGVSTRAERNAFFHQTRVRALARKWLSIGFLSNTIPTNVNVADICNATWNGTATNFFRSGGGCNNTGTIADVMYHEWGHALDQNTNLGDGSTGEATGDVTSMSVVHDARIGPYFEVNGNPVRDLDSTRAGYVASPAILDSYCLVCTGQCSNGPYGHEVHCEGEIYGQAHWDLAQAFIVKHGFNTGWQELERIYFLSLTQADTMVPSSAQSVYNAYVAVDDDNGNLADGTPNCNEIDDAFRTHGIAPLVGCNGNSVPCARPAEPVVSLTPGHGLVALDWSPVPNATQYVVLRADFSPTMAYFPLGTLAGTHFEDTTAQPGVTYWYVVEARTAGGCRSAIENDQPGSPLGDPRPFVAAIGVDDIPAGNRSGFADPGESIDITLSLRNALPSGGVAGGAGTLTTSTPGVTLSENSATWGPIAPGATVAGSAFRAALANPGAVCGSTASFALNWTDGVSGPATTASIPVLIGSRTTRYAEDFEGDLVTPWPASSGSPVPTAGFWIIGDPGATSWQPGGDATLGQTGNCLFTGTNTSDASGDVDAGETIATSPVIDLSGATAARLTYRRWWASSSLTDAGDTFIVEVSGNGGGSWVAAETVGAASRNLGWQPVEVRLESLVPLNDNFRMRVKVRDGAPDSNVEGAIDDVRIDEVICDLTPPCFVPPTFAGIGSATPGASCAETDLSWSAGSTSCQNAQVRYNVYRSVTPGFTPAPANRIATGLTGLSFHDTLLQPGATYQYIVRADDTRSGEDANLAPQAVVAPTAPDLAPPVFPGPGTAQSGAVCGAVSLDWPGAVETCSLPLRYNVYRSTSSGFAPSPANQVATVFGTSYIDSALVPGQIYFYEVHASDAVGNEEGNLLERSTPATILPLVLYHEDFEGDPGGWATTAPNDAVTGRFEWGDPELTGAQPEDDATPAPGVSAWVTGLAAGGGLGDFDVDTGTTTIVSPILDVTGSPAPILEVQAFFNNDLGANPGEDPLRIDISSNGGGSWVAGLVSLTDFSAWTPVQITLADKVPLNNQFRIRVQTQDLGVGGSLVEAGIDEVRIFEPNAGCAVCSGPVAGVGTITATRSGDDVLLDWIADPVGAPGYVVYLRSGAGLGTAVRLGSTMTKSFTHAGGAAALGENFYYEVTAVDACGRESTAP